MDGRVNERAVEALLDQSSDERRRSWSNHLLLGHTANVNMIRDFTREDHHLANLLRRGAIIKQSSGIVLACGPRAPQHH
jgi:hypothetical protein